MNATRKRVKVCLHIRSVKLVRLSSLSFVVNGPLNFFLSLRNDFKVHDFFLLVIVKEALRFIHMK